MDLSSKILSDITVYSKYARYLPQYQRRETWDEVVDRTMQMHCRKHSKIEKEVERVFNEFVRSKLVLPSMRSLQFSGKPIDLFPNRIMNCLKRDTKFITNKGVKSFEEFKDGDSVVVLSHTGKWRQAKVKNYGRQKLFKYTFRRGGGEKEIWATKNHRWILYNELETENLNIGDVLCKTPNIFSDFVYESASFEEQLYWAYGFVFGDGELAGEGPGKYKYSCVRLCGNDVKYEKRFTKFGFKSSSPLSIDGDVIVYTGKYTKRFPDINIDSIELVRAFVAGYLAADGSKNSDWYRNNELSQYKSIQSSEEDHQKFIDQVFELCGLYRFGTDDLTGQETNYGIRPKTYRYRFSSVIGNVKQTGWRVKNVSGDYVEEDVWCLEVEKDRSFVLSGGVVTGNCAAAPVDDPKFFRELMFLLMGGTGVGYSVQHSHINKLPSIKKPIGRMRYVTQDSIIGWAEAVDMLMKAYFFGGRLPEFDFRDIRPRGTLLKTSGGRAPGPEALAESLESIRCILDEVSYGNKLNSLQIHDICCHIAAAVLSGGIRRSAMICLFDLDDELMVGAKTGAWTEENPQRQYANNSAMTLRYKLRKRDMYGYIDRIRETGFGEPGFYLANDYNSLTNPCAEASVNLNFCNLTTFNMALVESNEDLKTFAKAATFIGTLQANYTDYVYLRPVWKEKTEEEALIGVSCTGVARKDIYDFDFVSAAQAVVETNKKIAKTIGINRAYRNTVNKPEGTSSVVLGTNSGIHASESYYGVRRTRYMYDESIIRYMESIVPELVETDIYDARRKVLSLPYKASNKSIIKDEESAKDLLERVRFMSMNWVKPGHRKGHNGHSVSATINVRDGEWEDLKDWMWKYRNDYNGLSILPAGGGNYKQLPFEGIDEQKYNELTSKLPKGINLSDVKEGGDNTKKQGELACSNGQCELL